MTACAGQLTMQEAECMCSEKLRNGRTDVQRGSVSQCRGLAIRPLCFMIKHCLFFELTPQHYIFERKEFNFMVNLPSSILKLKYKKLGSKLLPPVQVL